MDFGLQSENGYSEAIGSVVNMASAIGGQILANRYVLPPSTFKETDVIAYETSRDNRAFIVTGATVLLFLVVLILMLY